MNRGYRAVKEKKSNRRLADGHRLRHLGLATHTTFTSSGGAGASLTLEYLPELEALVSGGGGQHLTVRADSAVEYTSLVSGDLNVTDQSRVAPDAERVVREATGADDLAVVVAPAQGGDLGASIDAVGTSTSGSVPEVNVTIVRTTASGEKV